MADDSQDKAPAYSTGDDWWTAVNLLTGYTLPKRGLVFEDLYGNDDIPLMKIEISDSTASPDLAELDAINALAWRTQNSGWRIENTDFVVPFFYGSTSVGSTVKMRKARITLLGTDSSHNVPAGGVDPGGTFTEGSGHLMGDNFKGWDSRPLSRYSYGGGMALEALLHPPYSTWRFAWNDVHVDDDGAVDLGGFDRVADAIDRAARFFYLSRSTIQNWEDELGAEDASWQGQAAGVFWDIIHQLGVIYQNYSDTLPLEFIYSKAGQDLRNAKQGVYNALSNLHSTWSTWALYTGNPLRWLHDILLEVTDDIWDNNLTKVSAVPHTTRYSTSWTNKVKQAGFRVDAVNRHGGGSYGDLNSLGTWKAIGEEAIKRWQQSVVDTLGTAGNKALKDVHNSWVDVAKSMQKLTTSSVSLVSDYQLDKAAAEQAKADQDRKDQEEHEKEQEAKAEKERQEQEEHEKEMEAKADQQRAEDLAHQKEQEDKADKERQEQEQHQKEQEDKADKERQEQEEHQKEQEAQQQKQYQEQQDQAKQQYEQQRQEQQDQEKKQEELQKQQEEQAQQQYQQQVAMQTAMQKEQEKKQEEQEKKQEEQQKQAQDQAQQQYEQQRQDQKEQEQKQEEQQRKQEEEQKKQEEQAQQQYAQQQKTQTDYQQKQEQQQKEQEQKQEDLQQKQQDQAEKQYEQQQKTQSDYQQQQAEQQKQLEQQYQQQQQGLGGQFPQQPGSDLPGGGLPGGSHGQIGSQTHLNPDGTVTTDFSDGSSTTINPHTGLETTTLPDGSVSTDHLSHAHALTNPDGSTTTVNDDGTLTTHYPDGSVTSVNPRTGMATTHEPDGQTITTPLGGGATLPHSSLSGGAGSYYEPELHDVPFSGTLGSASPSAIEPSMPGSAVSPSGGLLPLGTRIDGTSTGGTPAAGSPMMGGGMGGMGMGGMGGMGAGGGKEGSGERTRQVYDDEDVVTTGGGPVGRRSRRTGYEEETVAGRRTPTASGYDPYAAADERERTQSGDRERESWVPEEEDVWGADEGGAPAVIG